MKRLCLQKNVNIIGQEFFRYGDHVHIGANTEIQALGGVNIGNNVVISYNCIIWTINHNYDGDILPYGFERIKRPVNIRDNVWIGRNVLINSGVTIGEGAVIGMGSVVTKNIPPLAIAGGNPAKIIKFRSLKKYLHLKKSKQLLSHKGKTCMFCGSDSIDKYKLIESEPKKDRAFFCRLKNPLSLLFHLIRIKLAKLDF